MEDRTYTYIFYDILEKVLELSENPRQFAEFLTQQIRELIGARTVIIAIKDKTNETSVFSVFPTRRKEWSRQPLMEQLYEFSFEFDKIQYLSNEYNNDKVVTILNQLKIQQAIAIPLIAANRKVGSILLMDIMDPSGIDAIIDLLKRLSGVFALIIRNSLLYHNLESLVAVKTNELQMRNAELMEQEHRLMTANEEYEALNEELSENIKKVKEINTQLGKAKEKAEEEEKKFRAIFENSQDAIGISKQGINVFFNDAYLQLFGYDNSSDLIGRPILQQIAKQEHNKIAEYVKKRATNKEVPTHYETIGLKRNGEEFPFEINVGNYKLDNEMYTIAIIRDISERKSYESNLKLAKEKAEESNRLKSAFLQNMSHEIRTPMNAISGFACMLNTPNVSDEKKKSFISIIQNSANQLLSIVNDVLTISSLETKQERIDNKAVNINNIIIELFSIFKPQAHNQNIALYAKQQPSEVYPEIYTDSTKITQILTNLLTNALKFTHNGSIEFGYEIVETQSPTWLRFYVKDSGIGIKPELHQLIFERFRQADLSINKKYGGTGLGLSISKGLVELLGGKIWVESEPGNGSTFYFTIPYHPAQKTERTDSHITKDRKGATILIAEDEEYNFLYIEELLIDTGYQLIHAKDGHETVELCKTNPAISLVLMDIKMPNLDGYSAAKIIKEFRPELPIIAQSAYALEHEIEKFSDIFDDYITKPINEDFLMVLLNNYLPITKA